MEEYKVYFIRERKALAVAAGTTVLEAEITAGIVPDAPCGGKGRCGKCVVTVDGREVLACREKVRGDIRVLTRDAHGDKILREGRARGTALPEGGVDWGAAPRGVKSPLLAAVDLGSTTIVAYLLDGRTGETRAVKSALNPQRQFGADVVMRASCAMAHGAEPLSRCVRETIDCLLREMAEETDRTGGDIVRIVMAGNSCMHHLFLKIPVDTLVLAPYEPKVKKALVRNAHACGLHSVHPEAELLWLPNIGGFVGADTVACLLAAEFDRRDRLTLLVDIGTNGEMVLGDRIHFSVCSTAAGPAFEGAKITCGMRGSAGAIDRVWPEGDRLAYHVIGEGIPTGLCGSGLLDAVFCLLQTGRLDESGRLEETYYFTEKVFVNQRDIREVQLAKAAIAAGIQILCKRRRIAIDDIQELLLAGAFGNYLDPDSACGIGMLPPLPPERIVPVGNASGEGARFAALSTAEFQRCERLAERAEFVELALDPEFQDTYVDRISFERF